LQSEDVFDADTPSSTQHNYLNLMSELLEQDRVSELPEKTKQTAELILQRLNEMPPSLQCEHSESLMVEAYAALGQTDKAWELVNKLLDKKLDGYDVIANRALAVLDPDEAAERMLDFRKSYPSWNGMDYMAIYCLWWGDVLIHPDIQAYYVKEGKWIDYLADRLPEYEQYRK